MADALLKVAEGYELIAAGLREIAEAKTPVEAKKVTKKEEVKTEAPKAAEVDRTTAKTFLTELSRAGKTQEVRNLIVSMGYEKLTDIPDEKLDELYQKAKVL